MRKFSFSQHVGLIFTVVFLISVHIQATGQESPIYKWALKITSQTCYGGNNIPPLTQSDVAGNVYVLGSFCNPFDADPGPGTTTLTSDNSNYDDTYLIKLDPTGNFLWATRFADNFYFNFPSALVIDATGNVFAATHYELGFSDFRTIITKFDASGNLVWSDRIYTAKGRAHSIILDASGNPILTGDFSGTVDFDPGVGIQSVTANGAEVDFFVLKLDSDGNFLWVKTAGGTSPDRATSIARDGDNNLLIGGFYLGTTDLEPGVGISSFTSVGAQDAFVLKLDNAGTFVWAKSMGGTQGDMPTDIAVNTSNNIFLTGYFTGSGDFDPNAGVTTLTSASPTKKDIFLMRLNADGSFGWASGFGAADDDEGRALTTDTNGNIIFTGFFNGTADFDPGAGTRNLVSIGQNDYQNIFIAKLDQNEQFIWAQEIASTTSTSSTTRAYTISIDAAGDISIGGRLWGNTDFDFGICNRSLSNNPPVGFVLKIKTGPTPGQPTITSFTPTSGVVGTSVVITGTNFSAIPSENKVQWNPLVLAVVTASTPTTITATVPTGATTGKIYVEVSCYPIAISVDNFTVGALPIPTITSFTPTSGPSGATVTIKGTNFSTTPANNTVQFNGISAVITASTATTITTTVPAGATTGKISVTVAGNTAISTANFTVGALDFITQWNLATTGSGATQLTIGTATSGAVNYAWQEISPGTATGSGSWSGTTLTVTGLPAGATIRMYISPTNFQRININNGADRSRLIQVEQWGSVTWTSMQSAFRGCTNLQVTATDLPNLSGVTNMSEMFSGCDILNSPSNIGSWNTGVVTAMQRMFANTDAFNQNIGAWNTAAVTDMSEMFSSARAFNQPIGGWNTAAVTNMSSMFFYADVFNQDIGAWNTSAVTNMSDMFTEAYAFNQNIGAWNTGAVTNMSNMFSEAIAFNQDISSWNTAAVTNMSGMFKFASVFNQNIGAWNTAAVTTMSQMFSRASAFNQNLSSWNTGAVTSMLGMFEQATAFNQNIAAWTLNPGVDLRFMFDNNGLDCNNYSSTLIGWSANPSTPNGRSLGATGRQYGTNAAAARTNLASTKSWTITGDIPSGVVCGSVPAPTITNFTPTSGTIGTTVTITGTNFSITPANNAVQFNGTTAVVTASTATSITTTVPAGATTGKISVTISSNTATSAIDFTVTTITNQPPIIQSSATTVPIDGIVVIDLLPLLSDPDDNLNLTTLSLVSNTTEGGATATLAGTTLELNYANVPFSSSDRISISVCDLLNACTEQELTIEVTGELAIFNALSPNNDGKNDFFKLENIEFIEPKNTVKIFNRWGDIVWETKDYNNTTRVFLGLNKNGAELPSGVYFYRIMFNDGGKQAEGFISLKR